MPSCDEGKRAGCSRVLTPLGVTTEATADQTPSWVCLRVSRTAPFLASLIISHLLARHNLERMRKEKGRDERSIWNIWYNFFLHHRLNTKISCLKMSPTRKTLS